MQWNRCEDVMPMPKILLELLTFDNDILEGSFHVNFPLCFMTAFTAIKYIGGDIPVPVILSEDEVAGWRFCEMD